MPRMLDLFCGRFGWSRAFAARGWECVGVDLVEPPEIPQGCEFIHGDILSIRKFELPMLARFGGPFDFICASSPCEEFSVHGMKHFHPNPKYPENGIRLFNHTREICEASGVPYVMENVRAAQQFVGKAVNHCGPFYLWGTGVPAIMPQGIIKGISWGSTDVIKNTPKHLRAAVRSQDYHSHKPYNAAFSQSQQRIEDRAKVATIPPELANCVADYAERLLEQTTACAGGLANGR